MIINVRTNAAMPWSNIHVNPSREEPQTAIFREMTWDVPVGTWVSRGNSGVNVAIPGGSWLLRDVRGNLPVSAT